MIMFPIVIKSNHISSNGRNWPLVVLWNIIKKHKNPKIDFAYLQRLTITKVKETRGDIFNG